MKIKGTFDTTTDGAVKGVEMIREALTRYKMKPKELNKAILISEESLTGMVSHTDGSGELSVSVRAFLGTVTLELACPGNEFNFVHTVSGISGDSKVDDKEAGAEVADTLNSILVNSFAEDIKYRYNNGTNYVRIIIVRSKHAFLYYTLGAMLLAVLVGMLLSALQFTDFNNFLNVNILSPVKTMYMNALKMIVAPVVFFSIVSCIVRFSDLRELGRVGGRIIVMYLFTTLIAVGMGIGIFYLFQPGTVLDTGTVVADASSITSKEMNISIKDMIVNIIPSNIVKPFLESDMLQLIFLAVISGVAAGLIGKYSAMIKDLFEAFNDLFLKITSIVIKFMPIAVFCSICSMMLGMGAESILSVLGIFGTFVVGLLGMMVVYCLLILIVGRINPIPFIKKYSGTMLQVFSMASSNASIPINLDACGKLGISRKIYSLSIPLGATLNMDGTCVHLAVFALALAKTYGVEITGASLLAMIISIIVLSVGAPGIPGSGLICLSVLLGQMQVPVEAIGLVMGIDSFIGMFRTMSNCLGDVAVSIIVAKRENALDMQVYKK